MPMSANLSFSVNVVRVNIKGIRVKAGINMLYSFTRYFTFSQDRFPNPEDMLNSVASRGRKMVCSIDPHIKEDDGYFMYTECRNRDLFIKDRNGKQYKGFCWPGRINCCGWLPVVIGWFLLCMIVRLHFPQLLLFKILRNVPCKRIKHAKTFRNQSPHKSSHKVPGLTSSFNRTCEI